MEYDNYKRFNWFARRNISGIANGFMEIIHERLTNLPPASLHQFSIPEFPEAILYIYNQPSSDLIWYMVCTQFLGRMAFLNLIKALISDESIEAKIKRLNDFNQDPQRYEDKLDKVNAQLSDLTVLCHDNINKVLSHGESIDKLLDESDKLGDGAKLFYKGSRKLNRCCTIL